VEGITITNCAAVDNGLDGESEGFYLRHVTGPVTIVGAEAAGNGDAGIALRDGLGSVHIRNAEVTANHGDGIKLDAGGGPMTVVNSVVDGNFGSGLAFANDGVEIESISVRGSSFTANGGPSLDFWEVSGPGSFEARCNDVTGNDTGLYLGNAVTVDARHIWWGHPTGPSGEGPGFGDSILSDGGGTILYDPWLAESFTAPVSGCPFFESDFESGVLDEWDGNVN
jgi:hypothetical protein